MPYCEYCETDFDTNSTYWNHQTQYCDICGDSDCPAMQTPCCEPDYYDEDSGYGVGIESYSYKPRPLFHEIRNGQPAVSHREHAAYHMGFELEISADLMDASPIHEWARRNDVPDLFYCKEDSSVSGFEIVSHPMSRGFFDTVDWQSFFDMLNLHYPTDGWESTEHGLHVHVSRRAFRHTSTMARWAMLWNRNPDVVQEISRRADSQWAHFQRFPVSVFLPYERSSHEWVDDYTRTEECGCCPARRLIRRGRTIRHQVQERVRRSQRFEVLNLLNPHTIEVRAFASTRNVAEFVGCIHFVAASVDFVREMQPWHATRQATSMDTFRDFVASHPLFSYDVTLTSVLEMSI